MSMKSESRIFNTLRWVVPSLLLTLAYAGVARAQAEPPEIQIASTCPTPPTEPNTRVYRTPVGSAPSSLFFPTIKASALAAWSESTDAAHVSTCTGSGLIWTCAGIRVELQSPPPPTHVLETPEFTSPSGATAGPQTLWVTATNPEGWGDPHLTTVDGVHYDFQSAGEFTALREEGFEVQTRQSPVSTATVPITNAYTGITHCVAIYTAVAAKIGSSRVTVQPSPGQEPDPKSMQVRVNGKLVTLGNTPYQLFADGSEKGALEGSITKLPDGMFEIRDAYGTQLVVTSAYWTARKVWYLNVNVYGTSAQQGTMGKLGDRSWLPALPDGSSLGPKPTSETERYQVLYEKFADAWRVTKDTSLFDYEGYGPNGETAKTADYTRDEWPRNHPQSCAIEGQEPATAATAEDAQQACANVVNAVRRADCVFDVMVTGNKDFGKTAVVAQRFSPLPLGWYSPEPSGGPKPPICEECKDDCKECPEAAPWWWCWVAVALGIVALLLLILLVVRSRKKP
jgi:hypothetical protein